MNRYESVNSFFDDPILQSFADEYFAEFEIIDEDANVKPFNTHQILVLDEHLETIHNKIDSYKTDENEIEMESIKSDIRELQNNLTSKTKKWVIRNLSNIWAKITKQSPLFLKDFLIVAKNAIIQESVKYAIVHGINMINQQQI